MPKKMSDTATGSFYASENSYLILPGVTSELNTIKAAFFSTLNLQCGYIN